MTSRKLIICLLASMVMRRPLLLKMRHISFVMFSVSLGVTLVIYIPIYIYIYIYICFFFNLTSICRRDSEYFLKIPKTTLRRLLNNLHGA